MSAFSIPSSRIEIAITKGRRPRWETSRARQNINLKQPRPKLERVTGAQKAEITITNRVHDSIISGIHRNSHRERSRVAMCLLLGIAKEIPSVSQA